MMKVYSPKVPKLSVQHLWFLFFTLLCVTLGHRVAYAGTPTFSSSFSPSTIAPNSTSTLTYIINNTANDTPVSNVAFTNTLPANVILASPVNISDSCSGSVSAAAGTSNTSYTLDRLPLGVSCEISVDVTSSTAGSHVNTTGSLASSEGNSGTSNATLTVDSSRPGFSVALSPSTIAPDAVSTLTYTIDNSLNGADATFRAFTTNLPSGVLVSQLPNLSTSCTVGNDGVTAVAFASVITGNYVSLTAGSTCIISVDITAATVGAYDIYSGDLTRFGSSSSGGSNTLLNVERSLLDISFPAAVTPGSSATLTFGILNNNRDQDITALTFTDDLNAALSGLAASVLPSTGFCGIGSTMSGTSNLTISGVNLTSGDSCSFDVTVLIPSNAAAGSYTNSTSTISYDLAGSPTSSAASSNTISVYKAPTVSMSFIDDPVGLGQDVTLRYTVTNTDTTNALSSAIFQNTLDDQVPGLTVKTLPSANSCGTGSTFVASSDNNNSYYFRMSNGALAAGDNCSFDVILTLPTSGVPGNFIFTTGNISGTVSGASLTGNTATDILTVIGAPALTLSLSSGAVLPGDTVTASFTLNYSSNAASDVIGLGFSVDLDAALSGLTLTSAAQNDVCGIGSGISGTSSLIFSGGALSPGGSCSFSVTLQIPNSAPGQTVTLISSAVTGTVSGSAVSHAAANQSMLISGLSASKIFVTNPVLPGSLTTLRYTISNSANAGAATAIVFTDSLTSVVSGLSASSQPATPCGDGSAISGTTSLVFSGGELQPGASCTFDVPVSVPSGAVTGIYNSTSSTINATVNGANINAGSMGTTLTVEELTVNLSTTASNPTSSSTIPIAINFSRSVVNFESSDLVINNGSVANFTGSGDSYSAEITPSADGAITIDLPVNTVDDGVDNSVKNPASTQLSVTYQSTPTIADPSISISSPSASDASSGPITFTVDYFDVTQVNLIASAITLNKTGTPNAVVTVTNGDTSNATVTLSSITGEGTLGIRINASTAKNSTKIAGSAGPSSTFTVDNTQPGVTISSSLSANSFNDNSFTATFTFSEGVTGFAITDITAANASISNFASTGSTVYTATITPDTEGLVTLDVAANLAQDIAGNTNTVATQFAPTYDATSPSIAITSDITGSATNSAFTATFTFSEDVAGFTASDVTATNATIGAVTASSASVYTAKVTPNSDGSVTLDVAVNAAQDAAGNDSVAASQFVTNYDSTVPTLAITSNISGSVTNSTFTATFTFNEDVTGFIASDVTAINATVGSVTASSASVYTATVTPTNDGSVTLDVAANSAQDSAGNGNTAATQYATTYDASSPTVVISSDIIGASTNSTFTATFTFNEDVTGFTASDVTATNATVGSVTASSASVYTATVTPTNDGSVTLDVAANSAQDIAGNGNTAATQFATTYDASSPTVVISSDIIGASASTNSTFTATFTFNEDVTGFTASDVTATNATVGSVTASSASVYTATVTPTNDGSVTLDVAANSAQDSAGNGNTAATQFATTYDASSPTVVISSDIIGASTNSTFTVTFTFNEDVTGFTASDVTAINATVGSVAASSASVYTATVTPTNDGSVTLDVAANSAQDSAGNGNTAATQIATTYDASSPTVVISSDIIGASTNSTFTVTFTFNEDVTGFTDSDVTATNASVGSVAASSASVYTTTVTPTNDGSVTLDVAANSAQDSAGNGNTAATKFATTYDASSPTVVISSDIIGASTNSIFTVTLTFNEDVTGFTASDVTATNATVGSVTASSTSVYTATVTPTNDGSVTLDVAANSAQDSAGNGNTAATQFATTYDASSPTVVISSDIIGASTNSTFTATFTFNEDVTGFTASDVTAINATVGSVTASSASVYTATVTPTNDGSVTLDVAANSAQDNAGNGNTAATQFATTYDASSPTVVISSDIIGASTNSTFTITFTFNEDVTGFTASDVTAINATVGSVTASSASVYTTTVTPTNDGSVTLDVAANSAQDSAGNGNTAATKFATTYDASSPTVVISSDIIGVSTNSTFTATFTFNEDVTGFIASDVTAINATVGSVTASSASVYTATVTPTNDGSVTLDVAANSAQDSAGNGNATASRLSVIYDATLPQLLSSYPANDDVDVGKARLRVSLTFDEEIKVNGGNVDLIRLADREVIETLSLLGDSVTLELTVITAQFAKNLSQNEVYGIVINSGGISDVAGNEWQGLTDDALIFTAANEPPGSNDDSAIVDEDGEVNIAVLVNDEDLSDGVDVSSVEVEMQPLNGLVSIDTETGNITYAPNANYNGFDSFTYVVSDTQGSLSEPATVSITINPINDVPLAENDNVSTTEDQYLTISILDNDLDVDEKSNLESNEIDPATIVIEDDVNSGELVIVDEVTASEDNSLQAGQVIYTPNINFFGTDVFTYAVKDTVGAVSTIATVTISVGAVNDKPTANDDLANTNEDQAVVINVVSNDVDNEDELNITSVTIERQGSLGTAIVDSDTGEITYTPNKNRFGEDSFLYIVQDQQGLQSNIATVTVNISSVNDAPVTSNDAYVINTRELSSFSVLDNDSDPDSVYEPSNTIDITSVSIVSEPEFGTVNVDNATGLLIYTPNDDVTNATDIFSYKFIDTLGELSNTSTVEVTLQLQSISLVAYDDSSEAIEDSAVTINLLANDGDATRTLDSSSINITQLASNGLTQINSDGSVTYRPNPNFFGEDGFKYTVRDIGGELSNVANVTIGIEPVNDTPIISGSPAASIIAGKNYGFAPAASDIDSNSLAFSVENLPPWSNFNSSTGLLSGIASESEVGSYGNILITVTDDAGASVSLAAFTIEVISTASLTPNASNLNVEIDEDGSATLSVLANDPNNLPLTYQIAQQPQSGKLSGVLPSLTYTPNENFFGADSFTYTASNGEYSSKPATVNIKVKSVNDAPVAVDDLAVVVEGQEVVINVLDNDNDIDNDSLNITRARSGQGLVTIVGNQLTYLADDNITGTVIIEYTISDGGGLSASAQVVMTISADENEETDIFFEIPSNIEVNATGLVTRVIFEQAEATDKLGNSIPITLQAPPFFRPGKHSVVWLAKKGAEIQQDSQLVTVHPIITIDKSQRVEEGRTATIDVFLNGSAPEYPVNIPYSISGTSDGDDHNLTDGTLVIESGTQASLTVDITNDGLDEGDETLIISIDSALNLGNAQYTLTITESGVAPILQLTATQNDTPVTTMYSQVGIVDVTFSLENKELSDIENIDWSESSDELNALNISTIDQMFSFFPETLQTGVYHIRATVTDIDGLVGFADITLVLASEQPELSSEDTDGDGIPDNQEGYGDQDSDGIDDYLDTVDDCNIQPVNLDKAASYFIEGEVGSCFRLGDIAAGTSGSIMVDKNALPSDAGLSNIGAIIDFVVTGLNEIGQSYRVVIPQQNVIPKDAMYRKYDSEQESWKDFVITGGSDAIHSAKGEQGICPPPGDDTWIEGVNEGHWCIQLTISDGGPNDDDGIANGIIIDPSGLAVVFSQNRLPIANDDELTFTTSSFEVLDVLLNDTDPDNDILTLVSANAHLGTIEISNNELVYVPLESFSGTDTVLYAVSDGNGGSDSASAILNVNINNAPQAQDDTAQTDNQTTIIIDVLSNDSDADGDPLKLIFADVDSGEVNITGNQLSYTPQTGFTGNATISYRINDDRGSVGEAKVIVNVMAILNQAPVAQSDMASTNDQTSITFDVLANDSDPDGDALTLVSATSTIGNVTINNNKIVYTPTSEFVGTAIVTYTVSDGLAEVSAILAISISKQVNSKGGSFSALLILLLLITLIYRLNNGLGNINCKSNREIN